MLSVREIETRDIPALCDYWVNSDHDFMRGMGVDIAKLPTRDQLTKMLEEQIAQPYDQKQSYCMIWEEDGIAIGHSNVSKITFGEEAYMHLHLWKNASRKKGRGVQLVQKTVPYFFRNLRLKTLYSEPYKLNPAPNATLPKAGFTLLRSYTCVPGWLNFEQEVNLWGMTLDEFTLHGEK